MYMGNRSTTVRITDLSFTRGNPSTKSIATSSQTAASAVVATPLGEGAQSCFADRQRMLA
jgi:hypothetical protein